MSHERRLQSGRNEKDAAYLFKSLTLRVQHQQMEPHNHISIIPFPFSLLSHAMSLLHVKKQSQIALDAHLFPIPVPYLAMDWPSRSVTSTRNRLLPAAEVWRCPFLTRPAPWPRNSHIAQRLGCSLPCCRSAMGCYRSEVTLLEY